MGRVTLVNRHKSRAACEPCIQTHKGMLSLFSREGSWVKSYTEPLGQCMTGKWRPLLQSSNLILFLMAKKEIIALDTHILSLAHTQTNTNTHTHALIHTLTHKHTHAHAHALTHTSTHLLRYLFTPTQCSTWTGSVQTPTHIFVEGPVSLCLYLHTFLVLEFECKMVSSDGQCKCMCRAQH